MGKLKAWGTLFIFLFLYFLILPFTIFATVSLNEVAIQPNQVVELYNSASVSADISSWHIDDAGGTTYFTVPNDTMIAPQSCVLFSGDFNFNKASPDVVRLFDNSGIPVTSSAKLVEQYMYPKAPENEYSFSKNTEGAGEWHTALSSLGLFNESRLSCIPTPTPTPLPTETPFPTSTEYQSSTNDSSQIPIPTAKVEFQSIFISEVYPYPQSGENEWVELYNGNDFQVNLDHWYIDDAENEGSTPKSFTVIIDPFSYGTVNMSSSLLNNNGDMVRLLNGDYYEMDSMEYGKISQGKSIGRITFSEDSFCEQSQTKNSANSPCLLQSTQSSPMPTNKKQSGVSTQNTMSSKKSGIGLADQQTTSSVVVQIAPSNNAGRILGTQTRINSPASSTPYLSSVSFSYSLLTIVSVFIKMKNA